MYKGVFVFEVSAPSRGFKVARKTSKSEKILVSNLVCDVEKRYACYSEGKSGISRNVQDKTRQSGGKISKRTEGFRCTPFSAKLTNVACGMLAGSL
jgi:hypothetical protein